MKQSEKNQKSRALILTHAFTEFASHGYEGSSLNQICARGNLSKGLLYHYYKNKDALYLSCVHVLFDDMTRYLRSEINLSTVTVEQYFTVRMRFFRQHPLHRKLFTICRKDLIYRMSQGLSIHYDRVRNMEATAIHGHKTVEDHRNLVKAIRDKDKEQAKRIMEEHLDRWLMNEQTLRNEYPQYFKS